MESIMLTIAASLVSISGLVVCIVATHKNHDPAQRLGVFMTMIGVALAMLHAFG